MRVSQKIEETTDHIEIALVELRFLTGDMLAKIDKDTLSEQTRHFYFYFITASLALECSLDALNKTKNIR